MRWKSFSLSNSFSLPCVCSRAGHCIERFLLNSGILNVLNYSASIGYTLHNIWHKTRINVITYKIEWSRPEKTCLGFGGRQLRNLWGVRPSKARGRSSWILWQPHCLPLREVCWLLACLAPSNFWGNGVGIRSDLGRNSNLPCLGSYFCTICLAWLACLGYLAGFYLGILRLPVGPLLGGHFPGSLQILCGAGDISGTAYFSFNYFGFSGLSYT